MKVSHDIWKENESYENMQTSSPYFLYWVLWHLFVVPIGWILWFYTLTGLIGGSFITPIRLRNVKKIHKDGSKSIRFYDNTTIL